MDTEEEWRGRLLGASDDVVEEFIFDYRDIAVSAAYRACDRHRRQRTRHFPDALSMAMEHLYEIALELRDGKAVPNIASAVAVRTFYSLFHSFGRESGGAPASGMVAIIRRRARVRSLREKLMLELGREPSVSEIVEASKADAAHLKDPVRQGAILSKSDFAAPSEAESIHADDSVSVLDRMTSREHDEPDGVLRHGGAEIPVSDFMSEALRQAAELSPLHYDVLVEWLGSFSGEWGDVSTPSDVGKALGVSPVKAARVIAELRGILQRIFSSS